MPAERRRDWLLLQKAQGDLMLLRQQFDDFKIRVEPALGLYERLVPYGIDRLMPLILDWFEGRRRREANGIGRTSIWNNRWARWAAILAVFYGTAQLLILVGLAYLAIKGR